MQHVKPHISYNTEHFIKSCKTPLCFQSSLILSHINCVFVHLFVEPFSMTLIPCQEVRLPYPMVNGLCQP